LGRLLRHPLLHFAGIGLVLFAAYGVLGGGDPASSRRVTLGTSDVDALAAGWTRQWGRPPSAEELDGLIEDHVRQEILYREALALGLDRGDLIVRRRLAQKMEFLASDSAAVPEPSESDLESFLERNRERFAVPGRRSFQQIYFGRDRHGDAVGDVARRALAVLRDDPDADASSLGDVFLLPVEQRGLSDPRVEQVFGAEFAERLTRLPVGRWEGPVASGYGLHLVKLEESLPPRSPDLEEVREAVLLEWQSAHREEASRAFYWELRERYEVRVEGRSDDS